MWASRIAHTTPRPLPLVALFPTVLAVVVSIAVGPTSGLDLAGLDTSVRPQDDLYRYVNGGWLARTEIPPDRIYHDAFTELADKVERDLQRIIEETTAAATSRRNRADARRIGDLYASVMNEARLAELGAAPILPQLQKIDAIKDTRGLAGEAGYLSAFAAGGPFVGTVDEDVKDPGVPIVRLAQGGTLLPDRDYYLKDDAAFVEMRGRYEQYLITVFTLTGRPRAAADARAVIALETSLARAQWTQADSRDAFKTNNRFALARLPAEMPGFDWLAWARPQGIDRTPAIILMQPSFFKSFAALVPAMPLDTWKAWLAARYITASAPYLSRAFDDARFDFFGRLLTGQELPRVRSKRGVGLVNAYLGDAVGRLYIEQQLSASAKTRVQKLVRHVLAAFRQAISAIDWMSASTRSQALNKLSKVSVKIGGPDSWRDYSGFDVKPDDLLGNVRRAQQFENAQRLIGIRQPADRGEWPVSPQTPNAFYRPAANEIVLPAAMLQPPFFDVDADDAVNYGAIGAIVGHEIGHAFDDRGRRIDGAGAVRDWWKPQDEQQFAARAHALVGQFNTYSTATGMPEYGQVTLGENLGDLGGLAIAYRAFKLSLGGRDAPVIDGLTGDQRFFMGWAHIWHLKIREEYRRQWLLSSPHALAEYRVNAPASNMPAFYEAFRVKPGDKLYREPATRASVW